MGGFIVRVLVTALAARMVFGRAVGCVLWVVVIVIGLAIVLTATAHAAGPTILVSELLLPAFQGPPSPVARGIVLQSTRALTLPASLPVGARVVVAASPDGVQPPEVDDVLRLSWISPRGRTGTLSHDFRRADRAGTMPFGPLELTGRLPLGEPLTFTIVIEDRTPPRYGSTALYLVVSAPDVPVLASPIVSPLPTARPRPTDVPTIPTATAAPPGPTATAVPPPTATPSVVVGALAPTTAPRDPTGGGDGENVPFSDRFVFYLFGGGALLLLLAGIAARSFVLALISGRARKHVDHS